MNIAEFFIALGFDIQGDQQLKRLDVDLKKLQTSATKLLAVFGGMTASMALMMQQAMGLTNAFRQFEGITGLSAQELQKWQGQARALGVDAEEVTQAILALQKQSAEIAMGGGNIKPWQLLGISPHQDPFSLLTQLKERIKGLRPEIARSVLAEAGISDNMYFVLKATNEELAKFAENAVVDPKVQAELNALNVSWNQLIVLVRRSATAFAAVLAPAATYVMDKLKALSVQLSKVTQWLRSASPVAKVVRGLLVLIAGAIVAITGALVLLVPVLALLTGAMGALSSASLPILILFGKITLVVLAIAAAITALVLIVEDLWTAFEGGQSVFKEIMKYIKFITPGLYMISKVMDYVKRRRQKPDESVLESDKSQYSDRILGLDPMFGGKSGRKIFEAIKVDPAERMVDASINVPRLGSSSNVRQENNIDITVHGSSDPRRTAGIIADSVSQEIAYAADQLPVPSQ